ncbi:hypothetical protein Glo7428_3565 [Gloeocapsa sp. PCC 7428]|uniref:helix-turn-helix domain-containing protein n=1 Tax=Gloeocapsa sp. PCC 7428 TaxID=1173026 RepID=UPI0002A5F80D|nr:helix-turn-helix domain-containing protein [Gloeocapsa sp. PCC 7428]AFZ32034.1 hypothetical protein Glo7428_3565 [Gloeocapsa sp. PCC 7428]
MMNKEPFHNLSINNDKSHIYQPQQRNFEELYIEESQFLTSFQREFLLKSRQSNLRPEYHRRIEIMLLADMGYSQAEICAALGCSQEMARYWIAMAKAGLAHKWNDRPIGRPKTIDAHHIARLQELVNHSPREYGYSFRCWTAEWLRKQLAKEFGVEVSDRHISRILQKLGLSLRQIRVQKETKSFSQDKAASIKISNLQSSAQANPLWTFNAVKPSK